MRVSPLGHGGIPALLRGESMPGLRTTGALDYSNGFGFAVLGKSRLGDSRMQGGVYQKRRTGYNQYTGKPGPRAKTYYVKMRSYAPTNPRTPKQQAHRSIFADAVAAWASLTNEQKRAYNERAHRQGRVGRNLFISEFLQAHKQ